MRMALTNALSASMLAMVVAAIGLVLTRRPAVLHCLWLIVLVKLVAPPILEVPLVNPRPSAAPFEGEADASLMSVPDATEAPTIFLAETIEVDEPSEYFSMESAEGPAPWIEPGTLWAWLGSAWLIGSLATAALAAVRVRRFQRVLRDADPAEPEVEEEVATLADAMGIRRPPGVVFVEGRLTPLLWAVGRPRLVIPRGLWKGLDARRRRMLVTHELAHLRRGDHWLRFFELAMTVAYWWLPVVWWVRRALRDVEEQCCDAWVVWMFPDHARTYAETLLDTVDFLNPVARPEPLLASGFGKVQHLRKRLTMVMLGTTPRTLGWSGTLGALALAGVLLPMSPTWAQKADPAAEAVVSIDYDGDLDAFVASARDGLTSIGKLDVNRDGKDDLDDAFMLSDHLDGPFVALLDDAKSGDATKTEEVYVVVDDSAPEGKRTEAVQNVIEKLNAQIEELVSRSKDEKHGEAKERAEKRIQALKSAVERLKNRDGPSPDVKSSRRIVVTRRGDVLTDDVKGESITVRGADGKPADVTIVTEDGATITAGKVVVTPDGKAPDFKNGVLIEDKDIKLEADRLRLNTKGNPKEIQTARRRVAELNRELAAKQKELAEANRKLAELQGGNVFTYGPGELNLRPVRVPGPPRTGPVRELRSLRLDTKDDARLDSLERKLSKVLDELESLKKSKDGQGEKK
jgi:beta-lactamase regulating signal transducer with metallopeptidase domain